MRRAITTVVLGVALTASGCRQTECGLGTIERNGACEPANETVGNAKCGPFTELQGDQCVPMFPPTICDPQTTSAELDPDTQMTTCIGTGGGGCDAPFACPAPADSGKQTICGQLFDFETGMAFAGAAASGARCSTTTPAADGPCSLAIRAYDAIAFGTNPQTATPLVTGEIYLDDCGRYRVPDIMVPGSPIIGLGIDDAAAANQGPLGTTNIVGIATARRAGMVTRDLDAYVVARSTTDQWAASGGPPISGGIFAMVFRANKLGRLLQADVTVARMGGPIPSADHYFAAAETTRRTIAPSATMTGASGTALVTGASLTEGFVYSGSGGGLSATCEWSAHAGVSLPNIVFVQELRPLDVVNETCDR